MGEFENKVVLITGASGGFGKCTAEEFLKQGAKLSLVDINEEKLINLKKDLISKYSVDDDKIIIIKADVTKEAEVENYVYTTENHFGTIDVFFNNAGVLELGYIRDITATKIVVDGGYKHE